MRLTVKICAVPRKFVEIGALIRSLREERKLDQPELAKRSKMSRHNTISEIENGSNARMATYDQIARGLGFTNALAMFASGGNRRTALLLRLWKAHDGDDALQKDVLKQLRDSLGDDEE